MTMLEKLSALEHEQWMTWTQNLVRFERLISDDRMKRWKADWIPYSQLSEDVKEEDRVWARKVQLVFDEAIEAKLKEITKALEGIRDILETKYSEKQTLEADKAEAWLWAWNICGFTTKDKQEFDQLYRVSREVCLEAINKLQSEKILVPKTEVIDEIRKKIEADPEFRIPERMKVFAILGDSK